MIKGSLFNPENLENWYDKVENLETNHDTILNLNLVCDSILCGTGAGNPYTISQYLNGSCSGLLRNYYNRKYLDQGIGFFNPSYIAPLLYMTIGAGWTERLGMGFMASYETSTPNSTITIPFTGPGIRLYYHQGNSDIYGTFTTNIDGSGEINHDMQGVDETGHYIDITGLTNTTHSLILKYTGTSQQKMQFQGIRELKGNTYGIRTNIVGRPGATATNYFNSTLENEYDTLECNGKLNPDLNIICLGMNDYLGSYLSYYTTKMEYIISKLREQSECMIAIPITPGPVHSSAFTSYTDVMNNLADEYGLAVLDLNKKFNGSLAPLSNYDKIHFNPGGHLELFNLLKNVLEPHEGYINRNAILRHPKY